MLKRALSLFLLLFVVFLLVGSSFVVAEDDDDNGNDEDSGDLDDDSGDEAGDDEDDSDGDTDDSEDDESEIELEAEVEDGRTKISIEMGEDEEEFFVESVLTLEGVVEEILSRTELTEEVIRANLKYEVEDEDSDDDGVDDESEEEVEYVSQGIGAEMRFLQLEFAIKKRILFAEAVVDYIENNSTGNETNMTSLRNIIAELEILAGEAENADMTLSNDELVSLYLDIKVDAKELIRQFREEARDALDEEDNFRLRVIFSEIDRENFQDLRLEIREKRRQIQEENAKKILESAGEDDPELLEGIRSGEISRDDLVRRLKEKVSNMKEDQKERLRQKIADEMEERKNDVAEGMRDFAADRESRIEARAGIIRDELRKRAAGERD